MSKRSLARARRRRKEAVHVEHVREYVSTYARGGRHYRGGKRAPLTLTPGDQSRAPYAYFVWEQSCALRDATGSRTAIDPADWERHDTVHSRPHASIEDVLASRGYL